MRSTQVATSPIYGRPLLEEMDQKILAPATRTTEVRTSKTEFCCGRRRSNCRRKGTSELLTDGNNCESDVRQERMHSPCGGQN